MNQCYRSITNASLGAWAAASELSQSKGKAPKSHTSLKSTLVLLLAAGFSPLWAQNTTPQTAGACYESGNPGAIKMLGCSTAKESGGIAQVWGVPITDLISRDYVQWVEDNIGKNAILLGSLQSKAQGESSIAIGANSAALSSNALAVGADASAVGNDAIALGQANANGAESIAIGKGAVASDGYSVALGAGSQSKAATALASDNTTLAGTTLSFAGASNVVGVVSMGGASGATRQIVNVAPGEISASSTDAVNGSQLFAIAKGLNDRIDQVQTNPTTPPGPGTPSGNTWTTGQVDAFTTPSSTGSNSLATGSNASASGQQSSAYGNDAIASGNQSVALGQLSTASGNGATALGQGATATGAGSVALGNNSNDAGRSNVVSVGAAGEERQISNVAPGTEGTDAVNLNQLKQMGSQFNQQFGNLQHQIDTNRREANAGTAGAMAMAGMPQAYMPGKSMVAAGAATYRGETSLAVGVSRISDSGRWVTKFTGSANSRGHVGMAVGAGYQW